eukprot:414257-Lingulodinium_polyedra.AAC.1
MVASWPGPMPHFVQGCQPGRRREAAVMNFLVLGWRFASFSMSTIVDLADVSNAFSSSAWNQLAETVAFFLPEDWGLVEE